MTSALFLSTDTLDKPLEGYAAHRKTPPSTDSLTQRSYLTHNKTAAIPNETAAATVVRREAHLILISPNPRRPRTKGPDGSPSECIPQHEAFSKRAKRAIIPPASNPPKTGHRRGRRMFTFRRTPQDARSPRRTKCAARASCMSEDAPESKHTAAPDSDYRAIDYPVFCNPAETPVTVERIRLMYSAFFSSAISSWFIRTSRRARTWAMDRAST